MRTKMFGPLLSLCLAATTLPLAGCDSVFASWLRYGDTSGGDGGIPEDLAGVDLTGADLTAVPDMSMPTCLAWEGGQNAGLPWLSSVLSISATAGVTWERVAVGDFDGDGLFDIAVAGTKPVAMVTNTFISVFFQNADCTFSPQAELVSRSNSIFDSFTDFRAFLAVGAKWDIGLLGINGQLIWCRHQTGTTFQCIDAQVPMSPNNNANDRKLIVDDRGRTRMPGDFVIVQQKGGTDTLLTVQRNGANNGYMALTPSFQISAEDPNYAVPVKFSTDNTSVAIAVKRNGTQDLLRVHQPNGTTASTMTSAYTPMVLAAGMDADDVYLYAGAFANDDYDDVVAIGKPTTGRPVLIFPFVTASQPATAMGSAFQNYTRDLVMARDLNSDLTDELVAVPPNSNLFNTYRRDLSGFVAVPGSQQTLAVSAVKSFTIARMRPSHTRPDLLYLSSSTPTQLVIHRPNPGFNTAN